MTHLQQVFINNIRFYRTKANFTQVEFAEEIGLSPNYLNAVENGRNFPSADSLQKMCDVLKISPYQLFLEQPEITKFNNKTEQQQLILSLKQEIDFLLQLYIEK
jgi:transcriptional regulator with XRE-family HTH domain